MLTKYQIELAIPMLAQKCGWTEEQAKAKLEEFMAIKAVIDFCAEQSPVSVDSVRKRINPNPAKRHHLGEGFGYFGDAGG